jgi:membrane-associated phospholipid phosphatase
MHVLKRPSRLGPLSIALGWAVLLVAAFQVEGPFDAWLRSQAPKGSALRMALQASYYVFDIPTFFIVGAALMLHANRKRMLLAYFATIAAWLPTLHLLKFVFGRGRPDAAELAGQFTWFGDPRLHLDAFPSGHTAQAFLIAGLVGLYLPWSRWILLPLAALVGLSRIATQMHFLSDAVAAAGLSLGFVWLAVAVWGRDTFPPAPWRSAPAADSHSSSAAARPGEPSRAREAR